MTSRHRAQRMNRVLLWMDDKPLPVRVLVMAWLLREKRKALTDARREVHEARDLLFTRLRDAGICRAP